MPDLTKKQYEFHLKTCSPLYDITIAPKRVAIFWDLATELRQYKQLPFIKNDSVMIILNWAALDWEVQQTGTICLGSLTKRGFEGQQLIDKENYAKTWFTKRLI